MVTSTFVLNLLLRRVLRSLVKTEDSISDEPVREEVGSTLDQLLEDVARRFGVDGIGRQRRGEKRGRVTQQKTGRVPLARNVYVYDL